MPRFSPLTYLDGYLAIEDHGLIGDGSSAALVGRDGTVAWLCIPRFDSPPVFASLLDARHGGSFRVTPADLLESRQRYEADTGVLVTELRASRGAARITDALTLEDGADLSRQSSAAGRSELLRVVEVIEGDVRLRVRVETPGGLRVDRDGEGVRLRAAGRAELPLRLVSSVPLEGVSGDVTLREGQRLELSLSWADGASRPARDASQRLRATIAAWRTWSGKVRYDGPRAELVRRAALTLKLLDHFGGGAIVAAPTSSLPEAIGGTRNWDYRYAWIRDAAFTVYALHRIACYEEASGFLTWALGAIARDERPCVLYDLDGRRPPPEREDSSLEGYRRSAPVRWGNAAAGQVQNDVYGEILDCAYQWAAHHGAVDEPLWASLRPLVEAAAAQWDVPDRGIWEVRSLPQPFTYSAGLCQVALDRGARLAERYGLPGDATRWKRQAEAIRERILTAAWNPELGTLTETLGGTTVDASLLALPLRRVVPADDPRMVATAKAVVRRLGAGDGLLYRYLPQESPDGLPGGEGAFLLCSFWLVDNWAYQGRLEEAAELYDSLCDRAGPLGLLPEQVDPATGAFLGNYPQAFSHVGLISSGVNLERLMRERDS